MANSRLSLLAFCIFFLCLFLSIQARKHYHTKQRHNHHHKTYAISEPPTSPSPQPAVPSNHTNAYNSTAAPSPSPEAPSSSDDGNADNSTDAPSPSPSPEPTNPPNDCNSTHAPSPSVDPKNPPREGNGYNSTGAPSPSPSPFPAPADSPNDGNVLDVRKFGAFGDGITDETEAFKMAWDTACEKDLAVILVPYGFSFMIQSTIFTGPCQGSIVFQAMFVLMLFYYCLAFLRIKRKDCI